MSADKVSNWQGREFYYPLKISGIPVKMVTYADQGDSFDSPHVTLLALQDLGAWLDKYLGSQDKKGN